MYMHAIKINRKKKKATRLKESRVEYIEGFEGRKENGEM